MCRNTYHKMNGVRRRSQIHSAWTVWPLLSVVFVFSIAYADESLSDKEIAAIKSEAALAFSQDAYAEALKILDPLVSARDVDALAWSGFMHLLGLGVDINPDLALKQLQSAAMQGNVPAANYLLWAYDKGVGVNSGSALVDHYRSVAHQTTGKFNAPNYGWLAFTKDGFASNQNHAAQWNLAQAEAGDAMGMYNTGYILTQNARSPEEFTEGIQWMAKAAELQHPAAQYWLGSAYEDGVNVEQDYETALNYYLNAAYQDHLDAQAKLGKFYSRGLGMIRNGEEAFKWYRMAAIRGQLDAQKTLGYWYRTNKYGLHDLNQAVFWYSNATAQGDLEAQSELGYLYLNYELVERNPEKGMQLLSDAAESGSALAHYYLGEIYQNGISTEQNFKVANQYYKVAAEAGLAKAQRTLAFNYASARGTETDLDEASRLLQLAADQHDPWSEFTLASWYHLGFALPKNDKLTSEWLNQAADHGSRQARYVLESGIKEGFARYFAAADRKIRQIDYIQENKELARAFASNNNRMPHPVHVASPVYPSHLAQKNISGIVNVLVDINKKGKVVHAEIEESFHPDAEAPALRAIKLWRFSPAIIDGKVTPLQIRVPLRFGAKGLAAIESH